MERYLEEAHIDPLSSRPADDHFQSLADYQATTPSTFFGGKPVLHYHSARSTLTISRSDLDKTELCGPLASLIDLSSASQPATNGTSPTNGATTYDNQVSVEVEVWIASDAVHLFSRVANKGAKLTYPSISLHARQGQALYMQLVGSQPDPTDDELESAEALLTPAPDADTATTPADGDEQSEAGVDGTPPQPSAIEALYAAVSACADLHPDPDPDADGSGGGGGDLSMLLAAAAGGDLESAGWITAENVHEIEPEGEVVDERAHVEEGEGPAGDGDGMGTGELGPGAGTRRAARDEDVDEETKWRRVE